MDMEFKNIIELYHHLLPALKCRERELKEKGCREVSVEFIWDTLKREKWSRSHHLTLGEMVNDILKFDPKEENMKKDLYSKEEVSI